MGAKKLEEYLKLPYTIEVIQDFNEENPGWVARVVELPGCFTESDTFVGLQAMLEDAMRLWIATALEDGLPIPEPRDLDSYSGKWIQRAPKSLHQQVVEQAQREGISLNQYVNKALALAVGVAIGRSTSTSQVTREEIRDWIKEAVKEEIGTPTILDAEIKSDATPHDLIEQFFLKVKSPIIEQVHAELEPRNSEIGQEINQPKLDSHEYASLVGEY